VATGFRCPSCNKVVTAELAPGQQSRCPFCGQAVMMEPARPAEPAVVQPQIIFCAKCGIRNQENNYKCTSCGFVLRGEQRPIVTSEDTMGGLIPSRNPPALWAYYLGIFSLVPCFGFILAIAAIIMGIKGLKKVKADPQVKGKVHAIIGVSLGGVVLLGYLLILVLSVVSAMNKN
jgi:predicted RNA-binding Zn-ribbon protein involved in translation (DUF1610 family)